MHTIRKHVNFLMYIRLLTPLKFYFKFIRQFESRCPWEIVRLQRIAATEAWNIYYFLYLSLNRENRIIHSRTKLKTCSVGTRTFVLLVVVARRTWRQLEFRNGPNLTSISVWLGFIRIMSMSTRKNGRLTVKRF